MTTGILNIRRGAAFSALAALILVALVVLCRAATESRDQAPPAAQTPTAPAKPVVYLAGELTEEDLIALSVAVLAGDHPGILLLDSPRLTAQLKDFLATAGPQQIIPVGAFAKGTAELEGRLGVRTAPIMPWNRATSTARWKTFFGKAERVVVCPAKPRGQLLQSACLAAALNAPLYILAGGEGERQDLAGQLDAWGSRELWAIGDASQACRDFTRLSMNVLESETKVAEAARQQQAKKGPLTSLVIANAADVAQNRGKMSLLAPWVAIQRRAGLLLTNEAGTNTAAAVNVALAGPVLAQADTLLFVAGLESIPMESRPNPARGKDESIVMEPLTPAGPEPFHFATGRLFHSDLAVLALLLARQQLLVASAPNTPRKALLVSNPGGGLTLLETFSRNTAMELRNCGYETTALFENEVTPDDVRRLMPDQDIFLWEGHYRTMVDRFGLPGWKEPMRPALVFLQSCLALNQKEALPLFERGAVSVVGSPTRNYSGSGGAFTLAFFDSMLYDGRSLGGALRHAKNFLLAYSLLKEKRLGANAKLGGANLRSAWAFTLWGDPTLTLPRPPAPANSLPPVRHRVAGNTIVLTIPEATYPKVTTQEYRAQMWPNARLAGLLNKEEDEEMRRLVPLLFAEVSLPNAPAGKTPRLTSKVPSSRWVFSWDSQRRCGYLLLIPRARDRDEVRFSVHWEE